jgi:hypothetical protein
MSLGAPFIRPTLPDAIESWKKILAGNGYSTNLLWIFEENLCIEHQLAEAGGFHFGFQTKFTPVPDDALEMAYDYFCETPARVVFYRLGTCPDHSVCMLLCDQWFDEKIEADGFVRHDEWNLSFYPGQNDHIEEVTDLSRWLRRVKRNRPLHDLDFCLSLATMNEIQDYGRPLLPYERFAERMLRRLRQILHQA